MRKNWSKEDKEFLIKNYQTLSPIEISKTLNRSLSSIYQQKFSLYLSNPNIKGKRKTYNDVTKEDLIEASKGATSCCQIHAKLGFKGEYIYKVVEKLKEFDLPIPQAYNRVRKAEERLVLHATSKKKANQSLKNLLVRELLLENKCAICSIPPKWNGKDLVLQLDHINGNRADNRIENLRFLCPNCHSQTDTYAKISSVRKEGLHKYEN